MQRGGAARFRPTAHYFVQGVTVRHGAPDAAVVALMLPQADVVRLAADADDMVKWRYQQITDDQRLG